jgi:hypothetical protein
MLLWLISATRLRAQSTGDTCLPAPTAIYFGNGVLNTHAEAESAMGKLDLAVRAKLGPLVGPTSIQFCLAYDSEYQLVSGGLINLPLQLLDALEQEGVELTSQVLSSIGNVAFAPPELQDIALASIESASTVNLALRPDLQAQEAHYKQDLSAGRKIIVVAHSQGNLYVNQAYTDLAPTPADFDVVAVASPADYVAGGGPWTTLRNDIITLVPGALLNNEFNTNTPGYCNPPPDLTSEINCHSFTDSYLVGNDSGDRILSEIISDIPKSIQPTWTERFPGSSPGPRFSSAMAFDEAHNEMLLFGGGGPISNVLNDTWIWNGANWNQLHPTTSPAVSGPMAYDSLHDRIVMSSRVSLFGATQTWLWDGSTWTQVFPATSPLGDVYAMAYDRARGKTVLFGGGFAQTWLWDGSTWTQVFPATSPPARFDFAMAYDAIHQTVVLFGGCCNGPDVSWADTWLWDGSTWTKSAASGPPGRQGAGIAYDSVLQEIILFGGSALLNGDLLGDTWAWNGSMWTQLLYSTNPAPRVDSAMAYDEAHQQVILFGGQVGNVSTPIVNDTWVWGPSTTN